MAYHPISNIARTKLRKAADASSMEAVAKEAGMKTNTLARILHGTTQRVREDTNKKIGAYLKRLRQQDKKTAGPPPGPQRAKKPQRPQERHKIEADLEEPPAFPDQAVVIHLPWQLRNALLARSIRDDVSPRKLISKLLEKGLSS